MVLMSAGAAFGQATLTQRVRMDAYLGLDPAEAVYREARWIPLTVVIDNPNAAGFRGVISVVVIGSSGRTRLEITRDLYLSGGSTRRFATPIEGQSGVQRLEIQLVDSGNLILAETSLTVLPVRPWEEVTLVVSRNRSAVRWASRASPPDGVPVRHLIHCAVEELPADGASLRSVHTIVFEDAEYAQLSPDQTLGLESFVAGGGNLVIGLGESAPGVLSTGLAELLPARVSGTEILEMSWRDLEPEGVGGLRRPIVVARLEAISGQALFEGPGFPLTVSAPRGRGRITVTAFSLDAPGLTLWPARDWLAELLFAPVELELPMRRAVGPPRPDWLAEVAGLIQRRSVHAIPPAETVGALFAAYVLLAVPLAYGVARRFLRPAWAWFVLPVVAVGFSVALYAIAYDNPGGRIVSSGFAVLETGPGSARAAGAGLLSFFAPAQGTNEVRFESPVEAVAPFGTDREPGLLGLGTLDIPRLRAEDRETALLLDGDGRRWLTCQVEGSSDLGGSLEARLFVDPKTERLSGVIDNRTALDLRSLSVVGSRTWYAVGDLPAGRTLDVDVPWPLTETAETIPVLSEAVKAPPGLPEGVLGETLLRRVREQRTMDRDCALVAYAVASPWTPTINGGRVRPYGATVLVHRFSPEYIAANLRLPQRGLGLATSALFGFPATTFAGRAYTEEWYRGYRPWVSLWLLPSMDMTHWRVRAVEVDAPRRGGEDVLPLSVYDFGAQRWENIRGGEIPPMAADPLRGRVLIRPEAVPVALTWALSEAAEPVLTTGSGRALRYPPERISLVMGREAATP